MQAFANLVAINLTLAKEAEAVFTIETKHLFAYSKSAYYFCTAFIGRTALLPLKQSHVNKLKITVFSFVSKVIHYGCLNFFPIVRKDFFKTKRRTFPPVADKFVIYFIKKT